LHYLNDFFVVLQSFIDASLYQKEWDLLCDLLGLRSNNKKRQTRHRIEFLSIKLDSEAIKARLSSAKLQRARYLVVATTKARSFFHQNLEILVDFLFFCAKVVILGRAFLSILYVSLTKNMRYHRITISMTKNIA